MNSSGEPVKKSDIIHQLIDLIMRMPLGEQYSLLNKLEGRLSTLKRKDYRQSIRVSVEYAAGVRSGKGLSNNISTGGMFIETRMPFHLKEDISLNFSLLTDPKKQIRINGQIARITPNGIGIQFKPLDEEQRVLIKSQLEML
jgi:hypothetical protein